MKKLLNKKTLIISILMIMLINCFGSIIPVNATDLEEEYDYTYETLEECLSANDGMNYAMIRNEEGYLEEVGQYESVSKEDIVGLQLQYTKIEDCSGIKDFINLEYLTLHYFGTSKIDFEKLPNLFDLEIENCQFDELIFKGLENLEYLDLGNIVNCKSIDLSNCNLDDLVGIEFEEINYEIVGLEKIKNWYYLHFWSVETNKMQSILNTVDTTKEGAGVYIYGSVDSDVIDFSNLKFELFDLYLNEVDLKIEGLENATNLEDLSLEDVGEEVFKSIDFEELVDLKYLYLNGINMNKLKNFEESTKLEVIDLWECYWDRTIDLNKCKNLQVLYVYMNANELKGIIDISDLNNLYEFGYQVFLNEDYNDGIEYDFFGEKLKQYFIMDDYSKLEYEKEDSEYNKKETFFFEKNGGDDDFDDVITNEYLSEDSELEADIVEGEKVLKGFTLEENEITIGDFLNEENFVEGIEVKVCDENYDEITDTTMGLGTGTIVQLYEGGNLVDEYKIVLYGDVSGEGQVNSFDALFLIKAINNKAQFKGELHKQAGRIMTENGEDPTAIDALAIVKAVNNKFTINQSK